MVTSASPAGGPAEVASAGACSAEASVEASALAASAGTASSGGCFISLSSLAAVAVGSGALSSVAILSISAASATLAASASAAAFLAASSSASFAASAASRFASSSLPRCSSAGSQLAASPRFSAARSSGASSFSRAEVRASVAAAFSAALCLHRLDKLFTRSNRISILPIFASLSFSSDNKNSFMSGLHLSGTLSRSANRALRAPSFADFPSRIISSASSANLTMSSELKPLEDFCKGSAFFSTLPITGSASVTTCAAAFMSSCSSTLSFSTCSLVSATSCCLRLSLPCSRSMPTAICSQRKLFLGNPTSSSSSTLCLHTKSIISAGNSMPNSHLAYSAASLRLIKPSASLSYFSKISSMDRTSALASFRFFSRPSLVRAICCTCCEIIASSLIC
mmetsp:Transcript_106893/g.185713  ORF Transcript_106893/g.185713 Transcript_106893/m.185713 type:complete len:396 (+) Transcript_106893:511-1698(+)